MHDRLDTLLQSRSRAVEAMRSLLDEADTRGGLTAEDNAELAKRESEIKDLDTRIEARKFVDGADANLRETQAETSEGRGATDDEAEYRKVFVDFVRHG